MRKHLLQLSSLLLAAVLLAGCSSAPAPAGSGSSPSKASSSSSSQGDSSQPLYVNVTPLKPVEVDDKEAPLVSSSAQPAPGPTQVGTQDAPAPDTSAQPSTPEQAPAEEPPAVQEPAEEKPVVQQPTEEKPEVQAPVEEKPVQQPAEEKPVQQPTVEKPAEEKPAQQPSEEAPVQKPVEEIPVQKPTEEKPPVQEPVEEKPLVTEPDLPEADALSKAPAAVTVGTSCVASGVKTKSNGRAVIDYSNTQDGYVMVNFTASTEKRLKVQVKGPSTTYSYNLTPGEWTVFPLSDGNGSYTIGVYENISGNKYSSVLSVSAQASLSDEFGPFIRPNQYVNYANAPKTVAKAKELTTGLSKPLDKVAAIYDYVVTTLRYDYDLATSVKSGYLPNLDKVLAKKSGICFDYAALMTGMLRSQDIPCKLVVGYAGSAYHAWINVWSESTGWINAAIYFDGVAWQRMDPTFASTANQSEEILSYIGDGTNYSAKYLY